MVNTNKLVTIEDLSNHLDRSYPRELAWDDDLPRIGFILGDKYQELKNILLSLDINHDVIKEAVENNVNLIVTHHPLIFSPIYKIDFNTTEGSILKQLIENNIAVYSMHTNYDVGIGGIADFLAKQLGLKNILGDNLKDSYLRVGDIEAKQFADVLEIVKSKYKLDGLRYAGDLNKVINKIAVFGGSGGNEFTVREAIRGGADLFITSEVKLNAVQYANMNGLAIIEVNHGIEKLALNHLKNKLFKQLDTEIFVSKIETDPFKYYK